jgi:NAD(P)-dependent dehydrogenase (short-subunit alcohol dehydrogenase family)
MEGFDQSRSGGAFMGVLTGKTAVITGASSGIGRAIALRLGEAGAHVFVAGHRAEAFGETVAAVAKSGGEVC